MQNTPNKKRKKAFTLVELIIVITILAVLATIAFLSFQSYTKDSRDASRAVNLSDITKALEIHKTTTSRFPTPDDISGTGQMLGVNLFQVGKVGTTNASLLKFDKTPVDPLTKTPYAYGLSLDNKYFQVAGTFENINAGTQLVSSTYAATNNKAKVEGNYKGLLKFSSGSNQYIGNVPSLIFSTGGTYDLISGLDPYFVINNGKNIPYVITAGDTAINQTTSEVLSSLGSTTSSVTGVILPTNKTEILALSGALGMSADIIGQEVLGIEYFTSTSNPTVPVYTGCASGQGWNGSACITATECTVGLENITLANGQTWACKNLGATTVWDGVSSTVNCGGSATNCNVGLSWVGGYYQWGRNDTAFTNGQYTSPYAWGGWELRNDTKWGGNTSDTFTGDTIGTTAIGRQGPCPSGWHVPSKRDWKLYCDYANGGVCDEYESFDANSSMNIVKVLKLPYSGIREWDTGNYNYGEFNGYYWSSSPETNGQAFHFNYYPGFLDLSPTGSYNRAQANNIRCIKD